VMTSTTQTRGGSSRPIRGSPIGSEVSLSLQVNRDARPMAVGDLIESVSGLIYRVESVRQGPKWYNLRVTKLDPWVEWDTDWIIVP